MVSGPVGMWYRAARYDTKEEALDFINGIKPALKARHDPTDNILTVTFGTPEKVVYAVVLGYPRPDTIAFVETLFDRPAVTLSQEELHFATLAVSDMRRGAGVSDQEASAWARQQLQERGASDDLIERVAQDFAGAGKRKIAQGAPAIPALPPGTPVKITPIPFLVGYQNITVRARRGELAGQLPPEYARELEDSNAEELFERVELAKLRRADKYQFTPSAIRLAETVRDAQARAWLPLERHTWIEFQTALAWDRYAIKAIYAYEMSATSEMDALVPGLDDPRRARSLLGALDAQRGQWGLVVITDHCRELYDFTYDTARGAWVWHASYICPDDACTYVRAPRMDGQDLGECSPCPGCRAACDYWASWLHTVIRIIRREFALAPEEPAPYPVSTEQYSEPGQVKVGKGKNAHFIKKQISREIAYKLVSFEVSDLAPIARERAQAEIEQEESAQGKPGNWLTLAGETGAIVWEYREIHTPRGRTLQPGPGKPWKAYKHIEIAPFKKWVPMLAGERKTIKRVTARRFAQGGQGEQK